eukprot:10109483-Lingulodinium_polyedra.AAC.1
MTTLTSQGSILPSCPMWATWSQRTRWLLSPCVSTERLSLGGQATWHCYLLKFRLRFLRGIRMLPPAILPALG